MDVVLENIKVGKLKSCIVVRTPTGKKPEKLNCRWRECAAMQMTTESFGAAIHCFTLSANE